MLPLLPGLLFSVCLVYLPQSTKASCYDCDFGCCGSECCEYNDYGYYSYDDDDFIDTPQFWLLIAGCFVLFGLLAWFSWKMRQARREEQRRLLVNEIVRSLPPGYGATRPIGRQAPPQNYPTPQYQVQRNIHPGYNVIPQDHTQAPPSYSAQPPPQSQEQQTLPNKPPDYNPNDSIPAAPSK